MKVLFSSLICFMLVFSLAMVTCAAPSIIYGGEAGLGYDFANAYDIQKLGVYLRDDISNKTTLYGSIESDNEISNKFEMDNEAWYSTKIKKAGIKIGLFPFTFGGDTDIIYPALQDFKASTSLQLDLVFTARLTGKILVAYGSPASNYEATKDGAYALALNYDQIDWGFGVLYGDTNRQQDNHEGNMTGYAVTGFFQPTETLQFYADYTQNSYNQTNNIVGFLIGPSKLPLQFRGEYDLEAKNKFNPWGIRVGVRLNRFTWIEFDRNQCDYVSQQTQLRLNIWF